MISYLSTTLLSPMSTRFPYTTLFRSRLAELDAVTVPTLVVQGERDPFGIPPPGPTREVVTVPGDHGLKADLDAVIARDRKSTRLNSSHVRISYAVFCLKKKN